MTNTTCTASGPVLVSPRCAKGGRQFGLDVETLDFSVCLIWRTPNGSREFFKSSRVYGALDAFVPGFTAEETRLFRAIPDHSVKDPALASFQRASKKAARVALLEALPELVSGLRAAGHQVTLSDEVEAKFSVKAGCSCPCSPGFVLSETMIVDGSRVDLHFS